jgi:hypothetical protein
MEPIAPREFRWKSSWVTGELVCGIVATATAALSFVNKETLPGMPWLVVAAISFILYGQMSAMPFIRFSTEGMTIRSKTFAWKDH